MIAYLIGSNLKGPLIASKISPNKTWSGTISSFFIIYFYFHSMFKFLFYSNLASSLFQVTCIFLYKKKLIKDFQIYKSHGGILDI